MSVSVKIRASSLGGLFDCPARFEAEQINHIYGPSGSRALLGNAIHASTSIYDHGLINNTGITIDEAAGAAVELIHKPNEEVIWDEDDSPKLLEHIAVNLHKLYCNNISPVLNFLAVEVTCLPVEISDLGLTLTGTIDRVYKYYNVKTKKTELGICDLKTSASAVSPQGVVKTQNHAFQIGVYTLLAQKSLDTTLKAPAQIIGLNTSKTDKAWRVGLGQIEDPLDLLISRDGQIGLLEYAAKIIHSGAFFPNPRSMFCSAKSCPIHNTCRFVK
jgi:hypothetical protein